MLLLKTSCFVVHNPVFLKKDHGLNFGFGKKNPLLGLAPQYTTMGRITVQAYNV